MTRDELLKYREYSWSYFSLHSDQRLRTFNFYIVVCAVFIGAYVNIFKSCTDHLSLCVLPYIITLISFIFWKLDVRTKGMIKLAETSIKEIDDVILDDNTTVMNLSKLNIFRVDDDRRKPMSYSKCFNILFFVIGLSGIILGSLHICKEFFSN